MKQATKLSKRRASLRVIALVAIGCLVIPLVLINLTPGRLGFADADGCTCVVTYTAHPSLPACEETRPIHCDGLWSQRLLAQLSRFDLTK